MTSKLQKNESLEVSLHLNNLDQATCMLHPGEKPFAVQNSSLGRNCMCMYLGNQSKGAKEPNYIICKCQEGSKLSLATVKFDIAMISTCKAILCKSHVSANPEISIYAQPISKKS